MRRSRLAYSLFSVAEFAVVFWGDALAAPGATQAIAAAQVRAPTIAGKARGAYQDGNALWQIGGGDGVWLHARLDRAAFGLGGAEIAGLAVLCRDHRTDAVLGAAAAQGAAQSPALAVPTRCGDTAAVDRAAQAGLAAAAVAQAVFVAQDHARAAKRTAQGLFAAVSAGSAVRDRSGDAATALGGTQAVVAARVQDPTIAAGGLANPVQERTGAVGATTAGGCAQGVAVGRAEAAISPARA